MELISYPLIMNHFKVLMKSQKVSYSRLAVLVKTPESTVKKWFLADDGTLKRINLICRALGTTLEEVLKIINKETVRTIKMGKQQQEHFLNDPRCFEVYWLLVYERCSPVEIESLLKLTQAEVRKYLLKLDRFKLIEYSIKEKALVPKAIPVRWNSDGPFMQKIFRDWSKGIIEESLNQTASSNLILQYFQISADSEIELKKDLLALEEKYARRTIRELSSLKRPNVKNLRFVSALVEGSFLKH